MPSSAVSESPEQQADAPPQEHTDSHDEASRTVAELEARNEQLEDGYGHQHPAFQDEAASAFGGRR